MCMYMNVRAHAYVHILHVHTCVCIQLCICICTNKKLNASMCWGCHDLPEVLLVLPPKHNGPSSRVPTCQLVGLVYQIKNLLWFRCLQGPANLDAILLMGLNRPLTFWGSNMWNIYVLACGFICVRTHVYTHLKSTCLYMSTYIHTYICKQFLSCFDKIPQW